MATIEIPSYRSQIFLIASCGWASVHTCYNKICKDIIEELFLYTEELIKSICITYKYIIIEISQF